ncbi:MAG: flagellar export chaperone FliS [Candidatus Wallbacteria bacterium]
MINQNQMQNKYLETQVQTASPLQLVCMLYDGAIKFANMALMGIKENNLEKKTVNIIKVEKIVDELRNTLNFDKGGEVAKNLEKLYNFIYNYLIEANRDSDFAKLEHVIKMLLSLRESWQTLSKNSTQPAASGTVSVQPYNKIQTKSTVQPASVYVKTDTKEKLDLAC